MRRGVLFCFVLAATLATAVAGLAQTETATLSGRVTDPQGAVVPEAQVEVTNIDTNLKASTTTNNEGLYVVPNLRPGRYRVSVRKDGFKEIVKTDIVLHVQDNVALNFSLEVGSLVQSVTVTGGAPVVNTESATVSTVIDRKFVENTPLNGRSFQSLILLTPGVVTTSSQGVFTTSQNQAQLGLNGEFSVNGQRTEANYYSVDGVSANAGVQPGFVESPSASGSLPVSTALGTTQGLVSVDALQEFRVQSSSYSAEYGRNPGGQFSFTTRSGTNQLHGTAFEYLRNDIFDANDWFNNFLGKMPSALRQNDFGATLGGPIQIPHLYTGKDRTFFFFSYEGLRLVQPQAASVSYVPNTAVRQTAPAALRPIVNAFPIQNGADLGNGVAEFIGTWSNPSRIDSVSVRLDHSVSKKVSIFFRFSDTSSNSSTRFTGTFANPASLNSNDFTARAYTLGASTVFSSRLFNELRLNYSSNDGTGMFKVDDLGGATPVDFAQLQGIDRRSNPGFGVIVTLLFGPNVPRVQENNFATSQRQWNVVDTVNFSIGRHQLKFGADYRRLNPVSTPMNPLVLYFYFSPAALQANSATIAQGNSSAKAHPTYTNFSAFAQDSWRVSSRLNLSMGLRWEVNPAPGAPRGNLPYTVRGNSLATLFLAPQGTPLWDTTWFNFAPRLGVAYVLRDHPNYETVVRGGGGVFFDTGQQAGSQGYFGPGLTESRLVFGTSFPNANLAPPLINPPVAPYNTTGGQAFAFSEHLQLPYTLHWNASIEQAFGKSQVVTLSYVGASGRRLLGLTQVNVRPFNPSFGVVAFIGNILTSSYNALQVQYQRRLSKGLQGLGSYTWSHCLDDGSNNGTLPFKRGNCDFDVRHNFSAAFSYDLPKVGGNGFFKAVANHWGLDGRFTARSAFPVNLIGTNFFDLATGQLVTRELNLVPGVPIYLNGPQYPGGRSINPGAFSSPPPGQAGNAPRNFARGFGAWQMDVAVRREFPIYEALKLQFRAEAFNIFNHPNFGLINNRLGQPTFGQAIATLANSLGVLSPLYQMGGARSMQFSLKLTF